MPKKFGKIGVIVGAAGAALALGAAAVVRSRVDIAVAMLIIGGMLYFWGGFLVVASTDYKRSSPTYWLLFAMRLLFACGAILTFVGMGQPR